MEAKFKGESSLPLTIAHVTMYVTVRMGVSSASLVLAYFYSRNYNARCILHAIDRIQMLTSKSRNELIAWVELCPTYEYCREDRK